MSKTKSLIITLIVSLGLSFFFLKAIWPVLEVTDEGYNTKGTPALVDEVAKEDSTDMAAVQEITLEERAEDEPKSEPAKDLMDMAQTEVEHAVEKTEKAVEDTSHAAMDMIETAKEQAIDTAVATVEKVEKAGTPAASGESQVHIVTAQGLKYSPLVTKIAVGDSVSWENMSSHDTQAIEGLIPEGAEGWHSAMGENFQHTFTQEGIYIYKCTPHFGAGMGGVIIVGNPVNLEAMKAMPVIGAAKRLVKKAIKAAEAA